MSVGDVRGFRRRLKQLERLGHTPKRSHRSVSESIEHNRRIAAKMAKTKPRPGNH
jgi:hypothetical protein